MKKLISTSIMVLLIGCGQASEDREDSPKYGEGESINSDELLRSEVVEASVTDALEALSDAEAGGESASLMLSGSLEDQSSHTKTCAVSGDGAVVSIDTVIDRTFSMDNPRRTISRIVKGQGSIVRNWTSSQGPVECMGNHAKIEWLEDVKPYSLKVDIHRSRTITSSLDHKASGRSFETSKSFSAKGTRTITWLSHVKDDTEGTITRKKSMVSEVLRIHKRKNVKGEEKELQITTSAKADDPMVVEVVRDSTYPRILKSKVIESGTLVAVRADDGKVETSFENVKWVFTASGCNVESGTMVAKVFPEGEDVAAKTIQIVVTDGVYVATDMDTSEELADFEAPVCSLKDFNR